jgi:hypothetical protein
LDSGVSWRLLPASRRDATSPLYLLPLAAAFAFVGFFLVTDNAWLAMPSPRWAGALRCVSFIALMSLLPLAAFIHALREGAAARPALTGFLAGAAAGGLAVLAYGLNCTEDSPLFVLVWYGLGVMISAIIGALAGRSLLKW